jgi:cell division septation protein DedD
VLHGDHDFDDERDGRRDREISLGTSTMLGIFFVLTLLLAGFFAFGYTVGRKSALTAAGTTDDSGSGGSGNDAFKSFKPSPGTAAIQPAPGFSAREAAAANASGGATVVAPLGPPVKLSGPAGERPAPVATAKAKDPDAGIVGDPVPVAPAPVKPGIIPVALGTGATKPVTAAGGSGTMVQVSAFTRQEDADVVVSALKRKGYNVFIRHEPQDSFLHVQLGPYGSRKEAEAMKEKLSSDGFNAMVK